MEELHSLCPHPLIDEETIWYRVPCGIPLPDIEDDADVCRRLSEAYIPERSRLPMMRAWCPRCHRWKEPLLTADGNAYMDDAVNQAQKDYLYAAERLKQVCEQLAAQVHAPDCIEIPLVQLAAQYAEVANDLHASEPEMYEPFETAIARIQQNIQSEMLRFRALRDQGQFGPEGKSW